MKTASALLQEEYMGVVAKLAHSYWRSLPPHVKAYVDVEDLIAEGVANLVKACSRFDPASSRSITFVWNVTQNHFRNILAQHKQQKRAAVVLSLDTTTKGENHGHVKLLWLRDSDLDAGHTPYASGEAQGAVAELYHNASQEQRRLLDYLLGMEDMALCQLCKKTSTAALAESETVQQLRDRVLALGLMREDFDFVLQQA